MTDIKLGKGIAVNLEKLLESRLLIQANSGGGKSWLLRKLLEESNGKVQQIIIDLEGEFNTLREKYDYLLVSKEGDVPINIKSASLLPKKILSTGVSTILDLSELKHHERLLFVKRFIDTMMNLSKQYWKPVLVVVDEAHVFAPEKGKSESGSSIIDLATRGRKRGYCICLATQRLSKLSKDAAAECNNKLIGRTGLDVDMKRAADELGFSSKSDMLSLRMLHAGEFYAFGTAISQVVTRVKVGSVKTSHPKIGSRIIKQVTATPAKIKKIAEAFSELDIKAEVELNDIEDYKKEIKSLRQRVTMLSNTDLEEQKQLSYENGLAQGQELQRKRQKIPKVVYSDSDKVLDKIKLLLKIKPQSLPKSSSYVTDKSRGNEEVESVDSEVTLGLCSKRIYTFLFQNPHKGFTKSQLGFVTSYSHKSGSFSNAISQLNALFLIKKRGSLILLNKSKPELAGNEDVKLSIDFWLSKLGKCASMVFKEVLESPDKVFTKEELGDITGYSYLSGSFSNAIAKLNSNDLINRNGNEIQLHNEIKEMC